MNESKKLRETALHIAARCWCDEETKDIEMDARLASAFARRLYRMMKIIVQYENAHWLNPPILECQQIIQDWESGKL